MDPDLLGRLLGGECERVLIVGPLIRRSFLEFCFPQTLGLPPLRCYSRSLTPAELAAEAENLAATERWITEDPLWAEHFMARAEVILSIETKRVASMSWRYSLSHRSPGSAGRKPAALPVTEQRYPEKLIRVTTPENVRQLRMVRAGYRFIPGLPATGL